MTVVDELWYLAEEAKQQAEQTYHRLAECNDEYLTFRTSRTISRPRFRTIAERVKDNGLPYGAHTLAYRPSKELLLVYHEAVEMWVLPGGGVDTEETIAEGARRELKEEAGIDAEYQGLGLLGRVEFRHDDYRTWGVLPMYEGRARSTELSIDDPDGEITDARWFDTLPENTRDRNQLQRWRSHRLE